MPERPESKHLTVLNWVHFHDLLAALAATNA